MAFSGVTMSVHYTWRAPDGIHEQLRLAHELREDLVRQRVSYEADLQALWSTFPSVAAAEEQLAQAQAAWTAAAEHTKAERQRLNRRLPRSEAENSTLAALREARQQRRAAISEVREQAAPLRAARTEEYKRDQRALYQRYVQGQGLFWCTWNDVVAQHLGEVKRLRQRRSSNPDAALRHHEFRGVGTIAVQIIRRGDGPARSPAILADPNGKYHNYLQLPWTDPDVWEAMPASQRRRAGRVSVLFRYGRSADGDMLLVELPVQQHRQLPPDADITGARLTLRHTPAGPRASLTVAATLPEPVKRRTGPSVAVHLGWRRSEGGIIAATWRSTRALHFPPDLSAVVIAESARTGRLVVPAAITEAFDRAHDVRTERGQGTRAVQQSLATWLTRHGPIEDPHHLGKALDAAVVSKWRGAAHLHALASAWADSPPAGAESMAALLQRWQRREAKLRRGPDLGQRRHARAGRDDIYRRFAAALATQVKTLVLDDLLVSEVSAAANARASAARKLAAHARTAVGPARLRSILTSAAARQGCAISTVGRVSPSRVHGDGCGYENTSDARYKSAVVRCDGCGERYDQDHAAAALMLQRGRR